MKLREAGELLAQGQTVGQVCRALGQWRFTQRHIRQPAEDEEALTQRIIELISQFGHYGYRRVAALLRNEDWVVNQKRVERSSARRVSKCP